MWSYDIYLGAVILRSHGAIGYRLVCLTPIQQLRFCRGFRH